MNLAQKIPLQRTLPKAIQEQVNDAFQRSGQALPCSVVSVRGAIVTVKFEVNSSFTLPNVTIPLAGAEYLRYPIQAGCKGYVVPADARLAAMSGIGGGVSDLSQPANLTALVFFPFGNAAWFTVDPNAAVLYGPNGVVLRDIGNASNITLTHTGVAITTPEVTVTATGNVTVNCAAANVTASASASINAPAINLTGAAISLTGAIALNGPVTQTATSGGSSASFVGPMTVTGEVTAAGIPLSTHKHTDPQGGDVGPPIP